MSNIMPVSWTTSERLLAVVQRPGTAQDDVNFAKLIIYLA